MTALYHSASEYLVTRIRELCVFSASKGRPLCEKIVCQIVAQQYGYPNWDALVGEVVATARSGQTHPLLNNMLLGERLLDIGTAYKDVLMLVSEELSPRQAIPLYGYCYDLANNIHFCSDIVFRDDIRLTVEAIVKFEHLPANSLRLTVAPSVEFFSRGWGPMDDDGWREGQVQHKVAANPLVAEFEVKASRVPYQEILTYARSIALGQVFTDVLDEQARGFYGFRDDVNQWLNVLCV